MTNEEYYKQIPSCIDAIESCIEKTRHMAADVIGNSLFSFDLCFCGLLDRSIRLAKGFIPMMQERNLTCAGALLRLQLDNCLRLFAIYIAEDEQAVVDYLLNGNSIGKLKDKKRNKMSDGYLKDQLGQYDKQLATVYDNASGFIHFSSKAIYQSIYEVEDGHIYYQVGQELHEKRNPILIECAEAYLHYYKLFLHLMTAEVEWKQNYDRSMEDQT